MPPPSSGTSPGRHSAGAAVVLLALFAACATSPSTSTSSTSTAVRPDAAPAPAAQGQPLARAPGWEHDWARGAVFYEVFVRSFQDSDGDGKGDLKGLTSRLDYLKGLGVEALWLMPVFASPSYHGYDTTDYETINPDYGTNADFEELTREAHRRGIRVIVDLVINHSSARHPWFVESASSPNSPRRDWYLWRSEDPGWTQPFGTSRVWHPKDGAYYYGVFWGGMPDLNLRNPEVRAEVKRLAKLWLDRGADGFRLDAARHLIEGDSHETQADTAETHAFWKELAAYVREVRPDALLVGENWTKAPIIATYYGDTTRVRGGDELPMNFDFPLGEALLESAKSGEASRLVAQLEENARLYPQGVLRGTFLTNHDMKRVATSLGNDAGKLRTAAALLLTLPGTPFLYYGEEVGLQNGADARPDELKRTPMPWDGSPGGGFTTGKPWYAFSPGKESANVAAQQKDPGSLLSHYRKLLQLRREQPALRDGAIRVLTPAGAASPVFAYVLSSGSDRLLVVHNLGAATVDAGPYAFGPGELSPLFTAGDVAAKKGEGGARLTLPGHATGVFRVQ